jgi:hypothetical protein
VGTSTLVEVRLKWIKEVNIYFIIKVSMNSSIDPAVPVGKIHLKKVYM